MPKGEFPLLSLSAQAGPDAGCVSSKALRAEEFLEVDDTAGYYSDSVSALTRRPGAEAADFDESAEFCFGF